MFRYYAEHPEEYRGLIVVGERLAALVDLPEEAPEVEEVARELFGFFEKYPPPEHLEGSQWASEDPVGQTMLELMVSSMSPAQQRVMTLIGEFADAKHERGVDG